MTPSNILFDPLSSELNNCIISNSSMEISCFQCCIDMKDIKDCSIMSLPDSESFEKGEMKMNYILEIQIKNIENQK